MNAEINCAREPLSRAGQKHIQNPAEYRQWSVFVKMVDGRKLFLQKSPIVDIRLGSKYEPEYVFF